VSAPMIGLAVAIWILVIPIALGFTLRGKWPETGGEFWATEGSSWIAGVFWPVVLAGLLGLLVLRGLRIVTVWLVKVLFRFGSWLNRFLLGSPK